MMRAINLAANEPTNCCANDYVRREMLLSHDTGRAHSRSQSVNGHLRERAWIFVGNYAGDGPGYGRVVRRKRDPMLKKVTEPLAFVGTLSPKRVLECRIDGNTIDCSFSRKNARLSLMVIVRQLAPEVEPAARANQGINSIVGKARVSVELFRICRESRRECPVGGKETACHRRQRKQPGCVRPAKVGRTRPDGLLIGHEILQERHSQGNAA